MDITGIIKKVYTVQEGISKTTNEKWKIQEFVIEEVDKSYPQTICMQLRNENITKFNIREGMKCTASFDIKCREWEGKSYNSINCWKIISLN